MPSIMQKEKKCLFCNKLEVQKHHVFRGIYRNISEKQGCYVYLCERHHTGNNGIHRNSKLEKDLQAKMQLKWQEVNHGNEENFRKVFGKSWI